MFHVASFNKQNHFLFFFLILKNCAVTSKKNNTITTTAIAPVILQCKNSNYLKEVKAKREIWYIRCLKWS